MRSIAQQALHLTQTHSHYSDMQGCWAEVPLIKDPQL